MLKLTKSIRKNRFRLLLLTAIIVATAFLSIKQRIFSPDLTASTKPIAVSASSKDKYDEHEFVSEGEFTVPFDGFVRGVGMELVNAREDSIFSISFSNLSEKDPFCPLNGKLFLASATSAKQINFPQNMAYPVKKGDRVKIRASLQDKTSKDYTNAYVKTKFNIVSDSKDLTIVDPIFLSVVPCRGRFGVPPNAKNFEKSLDQPYIVESESKIIFAGIHTHDYTDYLTIYKNGQEIFKSIPEKDHEGHNLKDTYYDDKNQSIPLHKGDQLSVKVVYSNPTKNPIQAAGSALIFAEK